MTEGHRQNSRGPSRNRELRAGPLLLALTFEEHPREGAEENEVKQSRDDAADDGLVGLTDAEEKEDFGQQEAGAEILVYRRSVRLERRETPMRPVLEMPDGCQAKFDKIFYLEASEQLESDDREDQAHDRDDAADVCDDLEGHRMRRRQVRRVHVHQYREVGQVVAPANGVGPVGRLYLAALLRPRAAGHVTKRNRYIR